MVQTLVQEEKQIIRQELFSQLGKKYCPVRKKFFPNWAKIVTILSRYSCPDVSRKHLLQILLL